MCNLRLVNNGAITAVELWIPDNADADGYDSATLHILWFRLAAGFTFRLRPVMKQCVFSIATMLCCLIPFVAYGEEPREKLDYAIVIHGGAGGIPDELEWRKNRQRVLEQALTHGRSMLQDGDASLDVVESVICILEDSPYFNAGRGAVLNAAGDHELDASIMDGRTMACGGAGGVRTVRHPISLARLVMTQTRHVLLVSDGAEKFADEMQDRHGIERVPNSFFTTEHQKASLKKAQQREAVDSRGTVGCVALDRNGNLAAGTSTGGLTNKKFGRVGDSPIISAGTYADNRSCGVSCTGIGEDFIRNAVAFDVSARMRHAGTDMDEAVRQILESKDQKVRGGIIAVDRWGAITMQFNTEGMSRAAADSTGRWQVQIGK